MQGIGIYRKLKKARSILGKLFKAFILQENLSEAQIKKIRPEYERLRRRMMRWFIKTRFPRIYKLLKKLFRSTAKE